MSTREKIALVEKAVALHSALDAQWDALGKIFDGVLGPLFDASYAPLNTLMEMIEAAIGDKDKSVQWFILETKCGTAGLQCWDRNGKLYEIRTAADLVAFIDLTS